MIIVTVLAFILFTCTTFLILGLADSWNAIGFAFVGGLLGVVITQLAFVLSRLEDIKDQNNNK